MRHVKLLVFLEMFDQGGHGWIEDGHLLLLKFVVVDMRVPAVEGHFDTADTCLDELTGGQAGSSKRSVPVAVAEILGSFHYIESF